VIHRKGTLHQHVDALSRAPVNPPTQCIFKAEVIDLPFSIENIIESQSTVKMPTSTYFRFNKVIYTKKKGLRKIVIPDQLQQIAIHHFHDNHGHPGTQKTVELINRHYYWPDMAKQIITYVKACHACQLVKIPTHAPYGELLPLQTATQPLEMFGMDTIVMGSSAAATKAKYIQVIVDHHSRYLWTYATPTNTTACMINILTNLFQSVGKPKKLLTDNYKSFTGHEFKRFLKRYNVKHKLSSAYHPQTCGMVEKHNHNVTNRLRIAIQERPKLKWSTLLPIVTQQYNNTIHSSTGFTPLYLLLGLTNEAIPLPLIKARQLAAQRTDQLKLQYKERYDLSREHISFSIGNLVLRKVAPNRPDLKKLSPRYEGPFEIIEQVTSNSYRIKAPDKDNTINVHISQLKPYYKPV